eukprot:13196304-Heterocapsa_arctica.AAC.1
MTTRTTRPGPLPRPTANWQVALSRRSILRPPQNCHSPLRCSGRGCWAESTLGHACRCVRSARSRSSTYAS